MPSSFLLRAIAISLLLHVVLFWPHRGWLPMGQTSNAPRANLKATLHRDDAAVTPLARADAAMPVRPKFARNPADTAMSVSTGITSGSAIAGSASASAAVRSEGELDAGGMRRYRLDLALAVQRVGGLKTLAAKLANPKRLEVRIDIAANGGVANVEVVSPGSGDPAVDHAALLAFAAAANAVALPPTLGGQRFSVTVPVELLP